LLPIYLYCLNCTKFDQLILQKIIKIVATRCQILRLKFTKFDFGWGSAPDPAGGDLLAGFKGPTSKGGEKRRKQGEGKGIGREREGKEGKGKGPYRHFFFPTLSPADTVTKNCNNIVTHATSLPSLHRVKKPFIYMNKCQNYQSRFPRLNGNGV